MVDERGGGGGGAPERPPRRMHESETERQRGGGMSGRQTDAGVAAAWAPLDCSCASATGRGNAPVVLARGFLPRGK